MAIIVGGGGPPSGSIFREPVNPPVPLGGGGIHWFGPGGSGVYYPQPVGVPHGFGPGGPVFGGRPVHFPLQGIPPFHGFGGIHGIPIPGPHPMGGGLAHIAARRAGRRAIALRRALY